MDTAEEFKTETGEVLGEEDLGSLNIVDEDEVVDLDDKIIPDDVIVDPLLPIDDEDEEKEDDELDDKAEIEAVMWQDYDER